MGIPLKHKDRKSITSEINQLQRMVFKYKSDKIVRSTSFRIDRSISMSFGSIRRSLKSLRRRKDLVSPYRLSSPSLSCWSSFRESSASMPNISVSHLDQSPTCMQSKPHIVFTLAEHYVQFDFAENMWCRRDHIKLAKLQYACLRLKCFHRYIFFPSRTIFSARFWHV